MCTRLNRRRPARPGPSSRVRRGTEAGLEGAAADARGGRAHAIRTQIDPIRYTEKDAKWKGTDAEVAAYHEQSVWDQLATTRSDIDRQAAPPNPHSIFPPPLSESIAEHAAWQEFPDFFDARTAGANFGEWAATRRAMGDASPHFWDKGKTSISDWPHQPVTDVVFLHVKVYGVDNAVRLWDKDNMPSVDVFDTAGKLEDPHINLMEGDVNIALYGVLQPKAVTNFLGLCTGEQGFGYKNTTFDYFQQGHQGYMMGGNISKGGGKYGRSLYGRRLGEEPHYLKHDIPWTVSMAGDGAGTSGSEFIITTQPSVWLDEKHIVVGRVLSGHTLLKAMYRLPMINGKPIKSAFHEFPASRDLDRISRNMPEYIGKAGRPVRIGAFITDAGRVKCKRSKPIEVGYFKTHAKRMAEYVRSNARSNVLRTSHFTFVLHEKRCSRGVIKTKSNVQLVGPRGQDASRDLYNGKVKVIHRKPK